MRVLLVVGMVAGGAGRHVHELSRDLRSRGHRVCVAGPPAVLEDYRSSADADELVEVDIRERPDPTADLRTLRTLRRLLADQDVVHAHGMRAGALAALAGTARRATPPLVVTLHNAAPSAGSAAAIFGLLGRIVARRAAAVLVVSPDLGRTVRGWGAQRVEAAVVAAPDSGDVMDIEADRVDALRRDLAGTDLLAVTVGRLAAQKRLDLLLDAAGTLGPQPGVRFVVAGDGPLHDQLRGRIAAEGSPVTLLGHRDDVPELLRAADLVVSAADWEGQPVWLQQAVAAGAPVVATDAGGTRAMLGDDAALWAPPGDASALADQVRRIRDDAGLRADMAARAHAAAARLPDAQAAAQAAEQVYDDIRGDAASGAQQR